ncbi:uncharacterized protein LOC110645456 isoform X1 [Hevea brasiliensis]|uniref:uncharacterized protein LOC110645456 isoform X1 n=1 Tax=Hevea brasiliensis TaxID=3981 RepID=UPI0025FD7E99|nr:uncharacterized protein LOC110645456 isoform X1 [Hevea brasiliensis]XP_058009591.1 uncharacterized protein LOC110645456 isoform X1 [Hevea brasiliensis]
MREALRRENPPTDFCKRLVRVFQNAKELVDKYPTIKKWNLLEKWKLLKLIQEVDDTIKRLMKHDLQAEQYRCLVELNKKMDLVIASFGSKSDATNGKEFNNESTAYVSSSKPAAETDTETRGRTSSPAFALRCKMKKAVVDIRIWKSDVFQWMKVVELLGSNS